ncbi:hypothetical protein RJ639_012035, partial [Escallonia herrerae]
NFSIIQGIYVLRILTRKASAANDGKPIPLYQKALCGLTAGAIGASVGTPADLALIRMQADATLPPAQRRGYKNAFHALYRIVVDEGILALWKGAGPTVVRAMALNMGMLASYDQSVEYLKDSLSLGEASTVVGSANTMESWYSYGNKKFKFWGAVQGSFQSSIAMNSTCRIAKTHCGLGSKIPRQELERALVRGSKRFVIGLYENKLEGNIKVDDPQMWCDAYGKKGFPWKGASAISGFFASACSLPFDYIKTQIQKMQPNAEGKYPYSGSLDCAIKTLKSGGPLKFYTGFPVYCARISPHVMLTWIFLNQIQRLGVCRPQGRPD